MYFVGVVGVFAAGGGHLEAVEEGEGAVGVGEVGAVGQHDVDFLVERTSCEGSGVDAETIGLVA